MKEYFKVVNKANNIYCYDEKKIEVFLHFQEFITSGSYGRISGIKVFRVNLVLKSLSLLPLQTVVSKRKKIFKKTFVTKGSMY